MKTLQQFVCRSPLCQRSPLRRGGNAAVLIGVLALLLPSESVAQNETCFPKPVALPGLSGPPDWTSPGTVRDELNEPRWAAAPQLGFTSDPTDAEGSYRILVNAAHTELSVSFQAPTDPDVISNADSIYFALTTDGVSGTLAQGVRIHLPNSGTDPVDVSGNAQLYTYDAGGGGWSSPLGTSPPWLKEAAAWRTDPTTAWGVNFKIDLTEATIASLNLSAPFKVMFAMHKRDEAAGVGINLWTPDPGCLTNDPPGSCVKSLHSGTLLIDDPSEWVDALAIDSGCPGGITISGSQIRTTNEDPPGTPAPNKINTTDGATNTFLADPTYPTAPSAGDIQGKFHVANWGSIADSNAAWDEIPNGEAVLNDGTGLLSFTCPANTATTTCDLPTPSEDHQCVYVELKPAPGQTARFTRAAAYRNMQFKPLSTFSQKAEISVKGLEELLGNKKDRKVYVYVYAKNMPEHGKEPVWLKTDQMAATRRHAENPQPRVTEERRRENEKGVRRISTPRTGIGDLDLKPQQALATVWPTYDVHVYYDSGRKIRIDDKEIPHLVPMYPFSYYLSHEGPLFGFSHELKKVTGAEMKKVRDDVYLFQIPNEKSVTVSTSFEAHEEPKGGKPDGDQPCPECPEACPEGKECKESGPCGCRFPGSRGKGSLWLLLASLVGAVGVWRLRRGSRTSC